MLVMSISNLFFSSILYVQKVKIVCIQDLYIDQILFLFIIQK